MTLDETFKRDGAWWRISAIAETFYIATRYDVEGEPDLNSDIIKVMK